MTNRPRRRPRIAGRFDLEDDTDPFGRFPELNEAYPRAEVRVFETGGHHTPMLFPVEFTRLVAEFADSTRGGAMREGDRAGKKD